MIVTSAHPHAGVTGEAMSRIRAEERHRQIIGMVQQRGYVSNEEFARTFGVTAQTVRRDLTRLGEEGEICRHHGGASLASSTQNIDYSERQELSTPEKRAIAELTARHIPNHSSLFINIGTTTEALARALLGHEDLRVITNNLNVAQIMARNRSFTVMVTGGTVRNRDGGIVGQAACDMIGEFRVDYGIIGISGIDEQGTLLDFDYDEVRAARAIIRNSRTTYLLADHSKFTRHPMVRMGTLSEVSALFTDSAPPAPIRERLAAGGVIVHVAQATGS
jgi:DeoR family glycerol-3-phosphate regulon repressor